MSLFMKFIFVKWKLEIFQNSWKIPWKVWKLKKFSLYVIFLFYEHEFLNEIIFTPWKYIKSKIKKQVFSFLYFFWDKLWNQKINMHKNVWIISSLKIVVSKTNQLLSQELG